MVVCLSSLNLINLGRYFFFFKYHTIDFLHCQEIPCKLTCFFLPVLLLFQPLQLLQCIVDEVSRRLMCFCI